MCGIAGWVTTIKNADSDALLRRMMRPMAHRGPDGTGTYHSQANPPAPSAALGHLRLAIIDLATGAQPMTDNTGKFTIVFNGEIYNYRELRCELSQRGHAFRTQSDTEVLLHAYAAWGRDCVAKLRGMFAFAIWDAHDRQLFLARDRFGKKPLFLYQGKQTLYFASEIKALLAIPECRPRLDLASIRDYLLFRYVPGPHTLFTGIRKLPPGHWGLYRDGTWTQSSYYTPPDADRTPDAAQPADPVGEFSAALDEAVRVRLVSDVPFGVFLSGGVDSSVVAALMARHLDKPVRSFSIGFREEAFSEARFARIVADHLKTEHEEILVDAAEVRDRLPDMIALSDAPVAEPGSLMVHLLSRAAARSVKMVLTGEGSDEVLAGYPKYFFERYAKAYQRLVPEPLHNRFIRPVAGLLPFGMRRFKTLSETVGIRDDGERLARWFGSLSFLERDRLLATPVPARDLDPIPYRTSPSQSPLRKALYFDQTHLLPDNLLERGDRMTMGASIEARMPFMDHLLIESVSRLDDCVRIRGRSQKWILRQVARKLLPREIAERPKLGFATPVRSWFQREMSEFLSDHLTGPNSRTRDLFDAKQLRQAIDDHVLGRQDNEKFLWMMINLELFQQQFRLAA
jgi:asparagine synthase (glutamine-hydrolysing)